MEGTGRFLLEYLIPPGLCQIRGVTVPVKHIIMAVIMKENLNLIFRCRNEIAASLRYQLIPRPAQQLHGAIGALSYPILCKQAEASMKSLCRRCDFVQLIADTEISKTVIAVMVFHDAFKKICRLIAGIVAQIPLPDIIAPLIHQNRQAAESFSFCFQKILYLPPQMHQTIFIPVYRHIKGFIVLHQL